MKFVVIDNGDKYSISANSLIDARVAVFKKLLDNGPEFWEEFADHFDTDVIDPDKLESYV